MILLAMEKPMRVGYKSGEGITKVRSPEYYFGGSRIKKAIKTKTEVPPAPTPTPPAPPPIYVHSHNPEPQI
jgi:hypothetical protein